MGLCDYCERNGLRISIIVFGEHKCGSCGEALPSPPEIENSEIQSTTTTPRQAQQAQPPSCTISTTKCFIASEVPQAGNPFSLSPTVGSTSPNISCGSPCNEEQQLNEPPRLHEGKPPGTHAPALRPAFNNPEDNSSTSSPPPSPTRVPCHLVPYPAIASQHDDNNGYELEGAAPARLPSYDDAYISFLNAWSTPIGNVNYEAAQNDSSPPSPTRVPRPALNNPLLHISSASIQVFSVLYLSHLVLYPALAPQHDDNNGYELKEAAPARLPCYDDAYISFLNAWSTPIGNVNYEATPNNSSTSFPPPSPTRVPQPKLPPGPRRRERCDDQF